MVGIGICSTEVGSDARARTVVALAGLDDFANVGVDQKPVWGTSAAVCPGVDGY